MKNKADTKLHLFTLGMLAVVLALALIVTTLFVPRLRGMIRTQQIAAVVTGKVMLPKSTLQLMPVDELDRKITTTDDLHILYVPASFAKEKNLQKALKETKLSFKEPIYLYPLVYGIAETKQFYHLTSLEEPTLITYSKGREVKRLSLPTANNADQLAALLSQY